MKQGDCHCSIGLTSLSRVYGTLYRAREPSLEFPCCYYVIHLSIYNEYFFNMRKKFLAYFIPSKQVLGVLPLKYSWNDFSSPSTFTATTLVQAIVPISPLDYRWSPCGSSCSHSSSAPIPNPESFDCTLDRVIFQNLKIRSCYLLSELPCSYSSQYKVKFKTTASHHTQNKNQNPQHGP